MATFLTVLGMFVSVMLIGIILLQRGRGGGLVGALSGLGGQSAFGTKAGDMFTRITIGIAAVWVLLAGISGQVLRARTSKFQGDEPSKFSSTDTGAEKSKSADGTKDDDLPTIQIDDLVGESKSKKKTESEVEAEDDAKPEKTKTEEKSEATPPKSDEEKKPAEKPNEEKSATDK